MNTNLRISTPRAALWLLTVLFTPHTKSCRCPGINVIVWSVKYKISITWLSFMSLSNPDGAIFYSAWFKYPSPRVCLQLNHWVNVQQPEKNLVCRNQWDKKQGELLTPGKTTLILTVNDIIRPSGLRILHQSQGDNTTVAGFPRVRKTGVFWVL